MGMTPDDIAHQMSEDIDDKDEFGEENFWTRTFQSLLDEGGLEQLAYALRATFPSDHVLDVGENYVVLGVITGRLSKGTMVYGNPSTDFRKVKIEFDPKQTISEWLRLSFIPKLKEMENERDPLNKDRHPLFFEDIDDKDEFRTNYWFWHATFQEILDEGGSELVRNAVLNIAPVIEVGNNFITVKMAFDNAPQGRNVKIPFNLSETVQSWMQKVAYIRERYPKNLIHLAPDERPVFEDLSPWGNEMGKPWGWQATVSPVVPDHPPGSGEGIDDTDEFLTGDENYSVVVSNKHYPDKVVSGIVGFQEGQHYPTVLGIDRNDWGFSEDFVRKVIWSAWWTSDEARRGTDSYQAKDLEPGEMLQMDQGGIEMLKYYNDPEYYEKNKPEPSKVAKGWGKVGTHTYESILREDNESTVTIDGKPFTKLHPGDLQQILAEAWHWPNKEDTRKAPGPYEVGSADFLYSSPDEIEVVYPEMFIWWGPNVGLQQFYDEDNKPAYTGSDLDDTDEFISDDPEVELQKYDDACRQAARMARDQMLQHTKTLVTKMDGLELLFVGAQERDEDLGPGYLKPFIIIGRRKPVVEDIDDRDEFTGYKIVKVCGWCKKQLGFIPTSDPKQHNQITHGMCRECEVEQYKQLGMEPPPPVKEDLDDKDEFISIDPADICEECDEAVGRENLMPIDNDPFYRRFAKRVCKPCKEKIDMGPVDDRWLREDIDDRDEFVKPNNYVTAWVSWPEGKFAGPDEAVAAASAVMAENGHQITLEDTMTFKPTNKDLPTRWKYEKVGVYAYVNDDLIEELKEAEGDIVYGSTHREPWVSFSINAGDNEQFFPPPPEPDYDEDDDRPRGYFLRNYSESTPTDIARSINEDITMDLAAFLDSQGIRPWTYAPGAGNSPRFSVRPGRESECVDEESGLLDRNGKDITKEFQEKQMIYTYIDTWTPPSDSYTPPQGDPNSIDDTDEFYNSGTECLVFASFGKYSPNMDKAVFWNGHWQNVE